MRIDFDFACPICTTLIRSSGEVASLDSGRRVEPIDQAPFARHMDEQHPGTAWRWGNSVTYRQDDNPSSTTRAT
jgi:hypothetical protein